VKIGSALGSLAGAAARRPWPVIAVAVLLAVGAIAFAVKLEPRADASTLVSPQSEEYRQTQRYYRGFGEEPITVLVSGSLQKLLLSSDIERLVGLEGCLSGRVPATALPTEGGANGPCGRLAAAHAVKVVYGPGTFLDEAARQIDAELSHRARAAERQAQAAEAVVYHDAIARGLSEEEAHSLARSAGKASLASFKVELASLALQYGITSLPSIGNPEFVSAVVFDPTKRAGTPKQRFAYLFPNRNAALVSVRLRAGLSEQERRHAIALIREAVKMPLWRLQHGESYSVSGEPVIVSDLTEAITQAIELLLLAVVLVMAATLTLVFAGRPRLLPLVLALFAAALTFGALSLAGGSLTIGTVAVLPVLVGLAVDYSIQLLSRYGEQEAASADRGPALIARAARVGGPTIVAAACASAAAILALLLSPVPMVRSFGLLLVIGLAIALVCAMTVGAASLALAGGPPDGAPAAGASLRETLAQAFRGARELLADNRVVRFFSVTALDYALRRPGRLLAVGLALAAAGWALDTQASVQTDIARLVPQNLPSLRALTKLEAATGIGGQINVLVSAKDVATPKTIEWMSHYQERMLRRFGYSEARGCAHARLCPVFSLPELFGTHRLTQAQVDQLLKAVPEYFTQAVLTNDRKLGSLAFGVRLKGLDQQQQAALVEEMQRALHPPAGVHASVVGLTALVARSGAQVASAWRRLLTLLVAVAAVALVLAVAFRFNARRVLAPLVPIVLATGWSGLILFLTRIPLNPMSALLGPLVVAVATEFSVLLSERYRQERATGLPTAVALRRTYQRTGAAVAASATTAIVGFGVLSLSQIAMLRDFGLVTLVDLTVALAGVLVALPAALVFAERFRAGR